MKLFVGLGNPDQEYSNTRHNIGHLAIDLLSQINIPQSKFCKNEGYMNEAGYSVQKLVHFYKIELSNFYLIHDDLDLPVGEYRLQFNRGPAGHHGVESVIKHLGTQEFWRVRIGIGKPDKIPVEKYVLQPFTSEEQTIINQTLQQWISQNFK